MKVIIAGGRDFIPKRSHRMWLLEQLTSLKVTHVICGMATGADTFGKDIADEFGLEVLKYPADWKTFGKSAGYKRNLEMAQVADACILFPGGVGTKHMEDIAKKYDLILIKYEDSI